MDINFTLQEIHKAAADFLAAVPQYRVIAFHGQMGAGKTTFIHALCKAMGVTDAVGSPTFSIINQYLDAGSRPVYHIDLYRLRDSAEAQQAGVEDCLYSGNYCLVEWPEIAPDLFPENTLHVYISLVKNDSRNLSIKL